MEDNNLNEEVETTVAPKKRKHRGLKTVLIILGILIGLILLVTLFVSPIAKGYILKHDKELIGRELTLDQLRINILTGKVKITDLVLYEDDDTTPFVSFDTFAVKVKLKDLLHKQVNVKHIILSALKVNVEQDRTWFNFNSIIDHFASDEPKEKKEESESSFGVILNDILIDKSTIRYADLSIGSEFLLRDISIRIPCIDLSTMKTNLGLDLCLGDSATLHTDLRLSENAENYFVNLQLDNLGVGIAQPYLDHSLNVDSLRGSLHLDLQAEGVTDHILDFDLKGGITLNDVSLQDTEGYTLGAIDSIFAGIKKFNMSENYLNLSRLYISGVRSEYITHEDKSTNFDIVLGGREQHTDTTIFEKIGDTIAAEFIEVQEKEGIKIFVDELCLDHTSFLYEDYTLPSPFHYEIKDLKLTSNNFNFEGTNTVKLEAVLNDVGKLNAQWQGSLDGLENHNLTLMLNNLKLTDFSPYTIQLFGFPLEKGTLSFHSQNIITNGNLNGINKLQMASPVVGDKLKDVEPVIDHIPLKLGMYLLTDKDDKLNIDLPISGNIEDPEFSYFKTILKVFGSMMIKVTTAPFRLLASDGDIQYIEYELMEHDFTAEEYTQLDDIALTMLDKPEVSITLNQKLNYHHMVQELSNLQIKRDFYISQHPEADSVGFDFLTNETIRAIKLNDKGLCDYAEQYSEKNNIHSKKGVAAVALTLYEEKSSEMIGWLLDRRNQLLIRYLTDTKGLGKEQVHIEEPTMEQMMEYEGRDRYEVKGMEW